MTEPGRLRITPVVLQDTSKWRAVNHKFIPLGFKIERAVSVDAEIRIILGPRMITARVFASSGRLWAPPHVPFPF
nr:unnamed protein product [Callosobruchus chinensis]